MNTQITPTQRALNLIAAAVKAGWQPTQDMAERELTEVGLEADTWLCANVKPAYREHVEISDGCRCQNVHYSDGMGYSNQVSGEIYDYASREYQNARKGTRIGHSLMVDSLGKVVELYLVK